MAEQCSFCGKGKEEVEHIITSSSDASVGICNECIHLAYDVVTSLDEDAEGEKPPSAPEPADGENAGQEPS